MPEKHKITEEGLLNLKEELLQLKEEIKKNDEDLNFARSQGDLSENADYDAAKEKQASLKKREAQINAILENYEIIVETGDHSTARLGGGNVTIRNLSTGSEYTFKIVGSVEAKPIEKISNTCPVAQAVLGHKVGDVVTVNTANPYDAEIVSIEE